MDDAHQQVALGQRGLAGAGAGNFPRHPGERGGKVVLLLRRSRQLDAQRALRLRGPEHLEDFLPQNLLRDANTDLGDRGGFLALIDACAQEIAQVEQALKAAGGDVLEIRLPESELPAMVVEQAELGR